jgi:hypothetical protein
MSRLLVVSFTFVIVQQRGIIEDSLDKASFADYTFYGVFNAVLTHPLQLAQEILCENWKSIQHLSPQKIGRICYPTT